MEEKVSGVVNEKNSNESNAKDGERLAYLKSGINMTMTSSVFFLGFLSIVTIYCH